MKYTVVSLFVILFIGNQSLVLAAQNQRDKPEPEPESREAMVSFLRENVRREPNRHSKAIASRFAIIQALPLAWFDYRENSFCIRLVHVHAGSSSPTTRGISIDVRGQIGSVAVLTAEVEQDGVKWQTKIIPVAQASELLALVEGNKIWDMQILERPRYMGSYNFALEIRQGKSYNVAIRDGLSEDTAGRGLAGFLQVVQRLVEIADIPPSEVFYGAPTGAAP